MNNTINDIHKYLAKADIATNVSTIYSGKPGCACGCNGKYYYTENGIVKDNPGYPVEVNMQVAKRMLTKIRRLVATGDFREKMVYWFPANVLKYISFKSGNRVYTIHFIPNTIHP